MLTEKEARKMMERLHLLKRKMNKSEKNKKKYFDYEAQCIENLKYFVEAKAGKYKQFPNHSDLVQDAMEALLKGIRSFKISKLGAEDEGKGFFFSWIGWFVNTKLSRSANNHTTIRYPMHIAKDVKPHKENKFPMLLDPKGSVERICEQEELNVAVRKSLDELSKEQRELVSLAFGFGKEGPVSITKICERKKISRANCLKVLDVALDVLRNKIEV